MHHVRVQLASLIRIASFALAGALLPAAATHAQTCTKAWLPVPVPDADVWGMTVFDAGHGDGPALYAGGDFLHAGSVAANHIAKWDGTAWSPLGGGMTVGDGMYTFVQGLAGYDDGLGGGPALYATGEFHKADGLPANFIARWDGTSWSALGSGLSNEGYCLTVFDDGSGPALYAGGSFLIAGGVTVNHIAKWNGVQWSALGSGVSGTVSSLVVFDDGTGPALYVAGGFTSAGGNPVNCIARWNGTQWSALGDGTNHPISALTVFDDGAGPALYAGGYFTAAGNSPARNIARWNGTSWSALAAGVGGPFGPFNDGVEALTVFDDGSGPALIAGGSFVTAGDNGANRVAKWDGTNWSWLGAGIDPQYNSDSVICLAAFDSGSGTQLHVGGEFLYAADFSSNHFATWGCSATPPVWTYLSFPLTGSTKFPYLSGSGSFVASTPCSLSLKDAKTSAPALLLVSLADTPTPFKGGTLLPVPVVVSVVLSTSTFGQITLPFTAPALPPGLDIYYQFAILDPTGPYGFALSNGLKSTTP